MQNLEFGGFVAVIVLAVLWAITFAARRPARRDHQDGATIVEYSWVVKAFAIFLGVAAPLVFIIIIMCFAKGSMHDRATGSGLMLVWLFFGALFVVETVTANILVSADRIVSHSPWRRTRMYRWEEIEKVGFSPANSWFIVQGRDKTRIRISMYMRGIRDFASSAMAYLPPDVYAGAEKGFIRL